MPIARLSLSFLGTFRATLDGVPLSGFKSNKVRALLAYLAVESARPHSRQSLAGLFWPELPDHAALADLRNALSNLHYLLPDPPLGGFPPFLLITRETVQFNPQSDCWVDVDAFDHQLSDINGDGFGRGGRVRPHLRNQGLSVNALESAVALYQGDFLAGFFVADSLPFEEWLLLRSEGYHSRIVFAMQQLCGLLMEEGDFVQAERIARQLLELEPYSEVAYRHLMRNLALVGQRSEALLQYTNLCRLLGDELDTIPEQETIELYEAIRSGVATRVVSGSTRPGRQISPPILPPFVAREGQLSQLGNYLAEAMSPQGRVAFILGEPGSGKTALLEEFSRWAMQCYPNLVAVSGSCTARSGLCSPYIPFVDILGMLSGDIESHRAGGAITPAHAQRLWSVWPDAIQALLAYGPGLVGTLLPAAVLKARVEAFTPPGASWRAGLEQLARRAVPSASNPQLDIFEQVTGLLRELARHTALLLIIDDLQWADTSSLGLLFHLGRRLAGRPILILGAYRSAEGELPFPGESDRLNLSGIVNEFQRDFGDLTVDLDQADGQAFVDALIDSEPNRLGKDFRRTLYEHTGGNPLFTIELLRSMQERQKIVCNFKGERVATSNLDWGEMPARVEGVIAERIRRLPDGYRQLLEAASVEGEVFIAEVAARLVGMTEDEARQQLFAAIARHSRLVRAESIQRRGDRRVSLFRFRHILYQKYIYGHLNPVQRAGFHQKTGEALETLFAESEAQNSGLSSQMIYHQTQLAWHFEQAGLPKRAIDYLIQAGKRAVQISANTEAASLFMRALALLQSQPATQDRDIKELDLQINLTVPIMGMRGWGDPEQTRVYNRVIELDRQIGENLDKFQLFRTLAVLGFYHFTQGEFSKAAALGEQLLTLSQEAQDREAQVIAHCILGQSYIYLGELIAACDHLERGLALYDADRLHPWMAVTGIEMGILLTGWQALGFWSLGYPERSRKLCQALLERAQALNHPMSLHFAMVHILASLTVIIHGSLVDFRWPEPASQPASENDLAFYRLYAETLQGFHQVELGQVQEGIACMRSSIAELQFSGTQIGRPILLYSLALAYLKAGLPEPGLAITDEMLTLLEQQNGHLFIAGFYSLKGELILHKVQTSVGSHLSKEDQSFQLIQVAENCFLKAIESARWQGAKSWELRAAVNLTRLWQRVGKADEARRMLVAVYDWFSEGFDTPDLAQAKQLLEELSQVKIL